MHQITSASSSSASSAILRPPTPPPAMTQEVEKTEIIGAVISRVLQDRPHTLSLKHSLFGRAFAALKHLPGILNRESKNAIAIGLLEGCTNLEQVANTAWALSKLGSIDRTHVSNLEEKLNATDTPFTLQDYHRNRRWNRDMVVHLTSAFSKLDIQNSEVAYRILRQLRGKLQSDFTLPPMRASQAEFENAKLAIAYARIDPKHLHPSLSAKATPPVEVSLGFGDYGKYLEGKWHPARTEWSTRYEEGIHLHHERDDTFFAAVINTNIQGLTKIAKALSTIECPYFLIPVMVNQIRDLAPEMDADAFVSMATAISTLLCNLKHPFHFTDLNSGKTLFELIDQATTAEDLIEIAQALNQFQSPDFCFLLGRAQRLADAQQLTPYELSTTFLRPIKKALSTPTIQTELSSKYRFDRISSYWFRESPYEEEDFDFHQTQADVLIQFLAGRALEVVNSMDAEAVSSGLNAIGTLRGHLRKSPPPIGPFANLQRAILALTERAIAIVDTMNARQLGRAALGLRRANFTRPSVKARVDNALDIMAKRATKLLGEKALQTEP